MFPGKAFHAIYDGHTLHWQSFVSVYGRGCICLGSLGCKTTNGTMFRPYLLLPSLKNGSFYICCERYGSEKTKLSSSLLTNDKNRLKLLGRDKR
jgi:hypothetical protein